MSRRLQLPIFVKFAAVIGTLTEVPEPVMVPIVETGASVEKLLTDAKTNRRLKAIGTIFTELLLHFVLNRFIDNLI